MGQIEVFLLLQKERKTGNESYFRARDVQKLLRSDGYTNGVVFGAWKDLLKLTDSGYLEFKMTGKFSDWQRMYRVKEEYINLEVK